jgi:hypothetical protein
VIGCFVRVGITIKASRRVYYNYMVSVKVVGEGSTVVPHCLPVVPHVKLPV